MSAQSGARMTPAAIRALPRGRVNSPAEPRRRCGEPNAPRARRESQFPFASPRSGRAQALPRVFPQPWRQPRKYPEARKPPAPRVQSVPAGIPDHGEKRPRGERDSFGRKRKKRRARVLRHRIRRRLASRLGLPIRTPCQVARPLAAKTCLPPVR